MLTSDQLDTLSEPIVELFAEFELSVIKDIARRLAKMAIPSAAWQVQRLQESGSLYRDILKELSRLTGKSEKELAQIFKEAGVKTIKFDDRLYKAAGLTPLPFSPAMADTLLAGLRKTQGVLRNLTLTTAISGQQAFIHAADLAYTQVVTGAMDYNSAIRAAVKSVGESGLEIIYPSGHRDKLDVATRRTVLTGVAQTAGQVQITHMDDMQVDLVAVSAHVGARDEGTGPMNHESWQGGIYSRSGTREQYKPFIKTTGYGTGPGLGGWNCVIGETMVSSPAIRTAYRRQYSGEIIVIHTARGKKLSITPNHPILTDHGWIAAKFLRHGDNVISRSNSHVSFCASPNINQSEARIEDVFESLCVSGMIFRFPASAGHFHGEISDSEVNIVFPNSLLRDGVDTLVKKKPIKIGFGFSSGSSQSFVGEGAFSQIGISAFHSPDSIMGFFSKCKAIFSRHSLKSFDNRIRATFGKWYSELCEIFSYRTLRYASLGGNLILPHARTVHSEQVFSINSEMAFDIKTPIVSSIHSLAPETVLNGVDGTPIFVRNELKGFTGNVKLDNIILIERKSSQSSFIHVYNLETEGGWYFANDIITHNCRHSFYPFFEGLSENAYKAAELESFANKTVKLNGQTVDVYTATQHQRAIERKIRDWKRQSEALNVIGSDNTMEAAKVREWQLRMREFVSETGLVRQRDREQVL